MYFDNLFPNQITQFAKELDAILKENGFEELNWHPDSAGGSGHDKDLWDSIKR